MKRIWKEHFVIILGVSLPALLILAVMVIEGLSGPGPKYPVLYAQSTIPAYGHSQDNYRIEINNEGALRVQFTPATSSEDRDSKNGQGLTVGLFDPTTDNTRNFDLIAPRDFKDGETYDLEIPPELAAMRFSDERVSPDGFHMEYERNSRTIFMDMFGYNRRSGYVLVNGVKREPIPAYIRYSYNNPETVFVGWQIKE